MGFHYFLQNLLRPSVCGPRASRTEFWATNVWACVCILLLGVFGVFAFIAEELVLQISRLKRALDTAGCEAPAGLQLMIDLLGFSMGGIISRVWLQQLGGARRTHRFISVGSPQQGTLTAQWIPRWLLAGLADMKRGSALLRSLNADPSPLRELDCVSCFCSCDLMVVPGWQARLPVGMVRSIPVLTHQQLIAHPHALDVLMQILLSDASSADA